VAEPVLEVRDLCIDFRHQGGLVRAVDGVCFSIGAGEIVGLVGESGSGKTISMLATLGLIADPNAVISGSIRYKGRQLRGLPNRALRAIRGADIAMIFQDPMTAMAPVHTVGWQIVEQIRAHRRVSHAAARDRAVSLLERMGVPDPGAVFGRYPHQLSGGMRQRAMIAMALSCDPSLLIADEPTTALDVTVQAQILALLSRLRDEFGSGIVVITHDMGVVAELAQRVMVMYAGRIVESGSVLSVFAKPAHPYTQGLLAAIPPIEGEKPRRLASIPGSPPSPADMPPGCAFAPRCNQVFAACAARPVLAPCGAQDVACFRAQELAA
jgi:peptide/nickel transport system ATP-binding protein